MVEIQNVSIIAQGGDCRLRNRPIACLRLPILFNSAQVDWPVVARSLRVAELVVEDDFAIAALGVSSEGRRGELEDTLGLEPVANGEPGRRRDVMGLVNEQIGRSFDQGRDRGLIRRFKGVWKRNDDVGLINYLESVIDGLDPRSDYRDAGTRDFMRHYCCVGQYAKTDEFARNL